MVINIIYSLFLFIFFIFVFFRFYTDLIYPALQFLKRKNEHGYILLSNSEFEHRAIVEKIIKRKLRPYEEVHHINGKTWDNRRGNLSLMTREKHRDWHYQLSHLFAQNKFPSLSCQRKKLLEDFDAELF